MGSGASSPTRRRRRRAPTRTSTSSGSRTRTGRASSTSRRSTAPSSRRTRRTKSHSTRHGRTTAPRTSAEGCLEAGARIGRMSTCEGWNKPCPQSTRARGSPPRTNTRGTAPPVWRARAWSTGRSLCRFSRTPRRRCTRRASRTPRATSSASSRRTDGPGWAGPPRASSPSLAPTTRKERRRERKTRRMRNKRAFRRCLRARFSSTSPWRRSSTASCARSTSSGTAPRG
mmetsp:Transcript_13000/g.55460  ORF Transcript_13000/g.55460 Transcript_13000/m.55460 type:complete len:229 (-) Transcript_13000:771-1457(-)